MLVPREFRSEALDMAELVVLAARMIRKARDDDPWGNARRENQTAPDGDWSTWLILAGRGFGKTRTGAEYIREEVMAGRMGRVAFVGPTAADVRDTMIEGDAGIVLVCERYGVRVRYIMTRRRVEFPTGAVAFAYSAEEPDRLRGPQHDGAWSDELAAWKYLVKTWDNLQFGLRRGARPRQIVTTTPRPLPLLRAMVREAMNDDVPRAERDVVVTSGSTYENVANLAPIFAKKIIARYEGTRLGRQELHAEILDDVPGALWSLAMLDRLRVSAYDNTAPHRDELHRIVIGVDPKTGEPADDAGEDTPGSETGIIVVGAGKLLPHPTTLELVRHGYVLDDVSIDGAPLEWASRVVEAFDFWQADKIIAEANNGGLMVEQTLRTVRPNLPIELVHASRGKITRAEPYAALYAQGLIHHVGAFAKLEDQMTTYDGSGDSPDRMDALVWGLAALFGSQAPTRVDPTIAAAFKGLPGRSLR